MVLSRAVDYTLCFWPSMESINATRLVGGHLSRARSAVRWAPIPSALRSPFLQTLAFSGRGGVGAEPRGVATPRPRSSYSACLTEYVRFAEAGGGVLRYTLLNIH